jgi:PTH1 family peptidyl-tRNA hydrolase
MGRPKTRWPGADLLDRLTRPGRRGGKRSSEPEATPDLIVVGIGNPGPKYEGSRHNVGFWGIDKLVTRYEIPLADKRRTCALGTGVIDGHNVVLAKPRTYVNESGIAVKYLLDRYRVGLDRLLVVYDDMDLPPGRLRLKTAGGPGGHNGMKSIISSVGDRGFPRLRIGVGRPDGGSDDIDYVLDPPSGPERQLIDESIARIPEIVTGILNGEMERTMDWANRGQQPAPPEDPKPLD